APVHSAAALAATDLWPGGALTLTVTASETLASISGTATSGTTTVALGQASKSGSVYTLAAVLPSTAPAGAWTIALTATDAAGNTGTLAGPSFSVRAPISITGLSLDKTAVTTAGVVNITI